MKHKLTICGSIASITRGKTRISLNLKRWHKGTIPRLVCWAFNNKGVSVITSHGLFIGKLKRNKESNIWLVSSDAGDANVNHIYTYKLMEP